MIINDILGLDNKNSVCYLNSLFQCLISCPSFVKYVMENNNINIKSPKELIKAYMKKEKDKVSKIINETNPNEEQHCVHEILHDIVDKYRLDSIFEMVFTEVLVCTHCFKIIEKKRDKQIIFHHFKEKNLSSDVIEKSQDPVEDFYCPKCKKKTLIIIQRYLTELPSILVVCLNKFFGKVDIIFPEQLKVKNTNYILVADIQHIGTMDGGHYFARIRRPNKKYYQVDDNMIQEISNFKPTKNTYLLFYNKY